MKAIFVFLVLICGRFLFAERANGELAYLGRTEPTRVKVEGKLCVAISQDGELVAFGGFDPRDTPPPAIRIIQFGIHKRTAEPDKPLPSRIFLNDDNKKLGTVIDLTWIDKRTLAGVDKERIRIWTIAEDVAQTTSVREVKADVSMPFPSKFGEDNQILGVICNPVDRSLAVRVSDGKVFRYTAEGKTLETLTVSGLFYGWLPDGTERLVQNAGSLHLFDSSTNGRTRTLYPPFTSIAWVRSALVKGEPLIAIFGKDAEEQWGVGVWNLSRELEVPLELKGDDPFREIRHATFYPEGEVLAVAFDDGTIKLWDNTGSLIGNVVGFTPHITELVFDPTGETLVCGYASDEEDKGGYLTVTHLNPRKPHTRATP